MSTLEALYAVPLSAFIRQRDAFAARLHAEGRTDEAAEVKRLRKPSVPLWAVNQLARQDSKTVSGLVDATDRLLRAQLGRGDMAEATRAQRAALRDLIERAKGVVSDAGLPPTKTTLTRIERTLVGAPADRQARDELRSGRLTQEYPVSMSSTEPVSWATLAM